MTHRSSLGQAFGGRASPYAPRLGQQDRSFSDLFEYVDAADAGSRGYDDPYSAVQFEDDDAPDVVHVKYMGQTFQIQYPAYSISESGVTVYEVRRRVAEVLKQDSRRIRLVYKDKELKHDSTPIKRYGCKQNSEIAVVVTEQLNNYGEPDNSHSSEDDSGTNNSRRVYTDGKRPRGLSSVRHRGEEIRRSSNFGDYLHPNGNTQRRESRHERKRSVSPGRSRDTPSKSSEKLVEPARPTPSITSRAPPADPDSPMGKVLALRDLYYDKWEPECQKYLSAPPSDATQREKEYRRLTETVMKHIIEAADAIETGGDVEIRPIRKKTVSEAQAMLARLDAVPRPK